MQQRLRTEAVQLDGFVNGLFGHLAVRGPFPASDGEEARVGGGDEVVADKGLGILGFWIADQGADPRPCGEHVASPHVDVWSEVAADLGQYPIDLFFTCNWILHYVCRGICCTGNSVTLPRQEENDTSIRGSRIDKTHFRRAIETREDNMNAGTWGYNFLDCGLVHFSDGVCEGASSVDDPFCFDEEFLRSLAVAFCDSVFETGAAQLATGVFFEARNFDMVHYRCAI